MLRSDYVIVPRNASQPTMEQVHAESNRIDPSDPLAMKAEQRLDGIRKNAADLILSHQQ
jgi:hypothetical protein